MKRNSHAGFTLIEILIVIAITMVLAGISIPIFGNAMNSYRESASVSAVTGAIQANRYQAIMHGYPYQLVFTTTTMSYQVFNEVPPATTFSLVTPGVGSATTPLPSAGAIVMTGLVGCATTTSLTSCTTMTGTTITFTFSANGTVSVSPGAALIEISNSVKKSLIAVSGVGNVTVTGL
jgi:prepilin-type N-terminal cleavage/methylation domain-containing protein